MLRRRHALELALGIGFVLGPMVYVLTLPTQTGESCVGEVVVVEPEVEPAPVSVAEPEVEPAKPEVEPEPEIEPEPEVEVEVEPEAEAEPKPEPKPLPEGPAQALLVNDNRLVLTTEADHEWAAGEFYEPEGTATYRVGKASVTESLPAIYADWAGRSYDLYGTAGKLCTATLGNLHVIAQYDGHGLKDLLGEDVDPSEVPASKWRGPLWRTQPHWLVADIVATQADCKGAVWARDATLPAPTVLVPSTDDNPIAAARIAQFEASPELAQRRREYRAWYEETHEKPEAWESSWTKMARANPATVTSWREGAELRLIEIEFGENTEHCYGGFDAYLGSVELVVSGRLEPTDAIPDPIAIFDADGDGQWEFVYGPRGNEGPSLRSATASLRVGLSLDRDWEPC